MWGPITGVLALLAYALVGLTPVTTIAGYLLWCGSLVTLVKATSSEHRSQLLRSMLIGLVVGGVAVLLKKHTIAIFALTWGGVPWAWQMYKSRRDRQHNDVE